MATRASITIDKPFGDHDEYTALCGYAFCFSPSDFADWVAENQDADEFEVKYRSPGGCVAAGFDIADQITELINAGKTVISIGYKVNSITTVPFLAANVRKVTKHCELIVHNPWYDGGAWGLNADQLQELTDYVRESETKLFNYYVERLGLDETKAAELAELMKKDTDLGSEKALEFGFATEIISAVSAHKNDGSKPFAFTPRIAAQIKNKNDDDMNLKKILESLTNMDAKINALAGKKPPVKAASTKLADETSLYYDGDLAVNTAVFTDEAMSTPAADGNYTLEDGRTVTVAGGKVTEIKEATAAEDTAALTAENTQLKADLATKDTEIAALKKGLGEVTSQIAAIKAEIVPGDKGDESLNKDVPQTKAQQFMANRRAIREIKNQA